MNRPRAAALAFVLLGAAYLAISLRHFQPGDLVRVIDYPLLRSEPRRLDAGWRFVPRGVARVSEYPLHSTKLRVDLTGKEAAKSREGARVEVEAELTYSIPPERVLELHRRRGPGFEKTWLSSLLRNRTAERIASVSYDLVRNRDPELASGIRGSLKEAVAGEGLSLESLRVFQVAGVGEASGEILRAATPPLKRKVVLVGLDSFDWRIADPLLEKGRMPNLARLIARGVRANLKTLRPILSPVIWTSIATGVKPSRHGIVDFVVTSRETGELVPVTSAMRQVPALWNLLSRQGAQVCVVAWWATWPAETVRGSIVTDRVAFQLFEESLKEDWKSADPAKSRGKTYPPSLMQEIRPFIRVPAEVTDQELAWFLPGHRFPSRVTPEQKSLFDRFRTVVAAGETYHAVALERLKNQEDSLAMIYYEGPDTTSHLFMKYRPPLLEGTRREEMELLGGIVDRYYERQDRFLGEVIAAAGEDADILVVSDHGFKSGNNRPPNSDSTIEKGKAAEWHSPVGIFVAAGPDLNSGVEISGASVLDIAPTILALYGLPVGRDMDGQPLTEALAPSFLRAHAVAWVDSYGGIRQAPSDEAKAASAADRDVVEKLRSLGYIGEDQLTAHNNRGIMALDDGDVDGAIASFEKVLDSGGAAGTMVRANLARAWMMRGDLEKARSYALQALSGEPDNKTALAILAGIQMKLGETEAAERNLRHVIAVDPTFVLAHSKLGELLQKSGREEAALGEFRKVIEIAPLSPVEHNNIGNIHRKRGELDLAMEAYREALRCDAQYIGAYNNLGLCLQEKGKLEEAKALYEKALAIRPENPILRNSLGTLLALKGEKAGAIVEFERAARADPDWPIAQGNLATLLFETGRFQEAGPAFERWAKIEPGSVEPRLGLGLVSLMLKKRDAAVAQFQGVLEKDPQNFRAHVALGETFLHEGNFEEAQRHLEQAARIEKDVPRVYGDLARIYERLGLKRQAEQAQAKSRALGGGSQ
ncbi:MAG TPA: tetratricopeptide repeat protein [Candidatus Polarisedimenticolia bacterium]|nr:tetratricopeptide repeat protein [Candidatus Polarisedimenticolia bacterium]